MPELIKSAARNLGWLLASRGVLAILSLFYLGFVTRSLGVHNFGRFALIVGAAQAVSTLMSFQTWEVIVRYGIDAEEAGDEGRLARLMRACAILDFAGAAAGAALSIAIITSSAELLGIPPTLERATIIFAVVQLLCIRSTPIGILRLRDRFAYSALADSMTAVMRFAGALVVMLVHPTVQGFMVAWALAELVTAGTYWTITARNGDLARMWRARVHPRRLAAENPGIWRFALSSNANTTLGLTTKQVPLLLVGAALGPAAAGVYRLGAQVAQALAKLSQLIARASFPEVVKAVRNARHGRVGRILSRTVLVSTGAGLVILAVVALLGEWILRAIGGGDFTAAYPVLLWLAAAGCLDLATVPVETVLKAMGRAGTIFAVRAIAALATLAAVLVLLPMYFEAGVAMAVLAGSIVTALLLAGAAAWRLGGGGALPDAGKAPH